MGCLLRQGEDGVVDFVVGDIYRHHQIGAGPGTEDGESAIREESKAIYRLMSSTDAAIGCATERHIRAKYQMIARGQPVPNDGQRNAAMRMAGRVEMDFMIDVGARKVVILHISRYNRAVGRCVGSARAKLGGGDKYQ